MNTPQFASLRRRSQGTGPFTDHLSRFTSHAFSLVEVTIAVGIAGFCLLAIFGLIPVGLNSNNASINQTTAANLARGIISDLRVTPRSGTTPASPLYQIPVPSAGTSTYTIYLAEDGTIANTAGGDATLSLNPLYRATLVFTVPPAKTSYFGKASTTATQGKATCVRLLLTWPALADKTAATEPTKFSGSYELVTVLDRN